MNILKMYTDLIRYQFYFSFDFILVFIRCFLPIASCKKLKTEQTNRYYFNVYLILFFMTMTFRFGKLSMILLQIKTN